MAFPKMYCTRCNYKFQPKGHLPKVCPYCGKPGGLEEAKQMQDLINDFSDTI